MAELNDGSTRDWVGYAEGRRRGAIIRSSGLVIAAACPLVLRGGFSSGPWTPAVIAVSGFVLTAVVIGFAVRPRLTSQGTAFQTLTPLGSIADGSVNVTNPNATMPGRIVISPDGITWASRRHGELTWPRSEIASVTVRRVASFRPLGYLTIRSSKRPTFSTRIFQPREINDALRATGYSDRD